MIRLIAMKMRDRQTYQFSLRSLLIAVLLISIVCAWYGHRIRRVREESRILEGKWQVMREGKPDMLGDKPHIVEFSPGNYSVDPTQNPKWLDFHTARGTEHAIYRWEGPRLFVMHMSAGMQRPTSFDQEHFLVEPGAKVTISGTSKYHLERLPDQSETSANPAVSRQETD